MMSMPMNPCGNCEQHSHCAFTGAEPDRCPFCHCTWAKITAPATEVTRRAGTSKDGRRITVEETRYLSGYGHTPLTHLWQHATGEAGRTAKAAAASKRKQVAA